MDKHRLSALMARVSAATPGPWEVTEIRDGRQPEGVEELGVFAPNDPRSYQKPDETWHGALVCRGMDGPTRAANAAFIAYAREDVCALGADVERLAAALATARREARADALRECLDIAMSEGSTSVITQRIHDLIGGE